MKKLISIFMAVLFLLTCLTPAFAADVDRIDEYKAMFEAGEGPEVDGLSVDYVSYSPKGGGKHPLVIYFHGMGQGKEPGAQIEENNFPLWASDELQSRFTSGGAFLFVPRTHEENREYWDDKYIPAVKAAVDEFIAANRNRIDLTRIYVGGFSMGGKMTLKMITSYPDFFAAAFPMCPAYFPTDAQFEAVKDLPIWLLASKYDVIAGYHTTGEDVWDGICSHTEIPGDCRLTVFGKVTYPDGKKTPSNHHIWFAVSNDLFTYEEEPYYNTVTENAKGEKIEVTSPDGIISWLCSYRSSYNGKNAEFTDLLKDNDENLLKFGSSILRAVGLAFADTVKAIFGK